MCASLAGVLFTTYFFKKSIQKNMGLLVSFSAGVFLVVTYGLLREVFSESSSIGIPLVFMGIGIVATGFTARLLPGFHHHHDDGHEDHDHSHLDVRRILMGDALHNIADGVLITSAFAVNVSFGIAATVSIFFHEVVQEVSEFFVLRQAGYSVGKALRTNFIVSSTIFIGVLASVILLEKVHAIELPLLAFAAGTFLIVALQDLIPESIRSSRKENNYVKYFIFFILGAGVMFGVNALTSGSHVHDNESHDEEGHEHDKHDEHEHDSHSTHMDGKTLGARESFLLGQATTLPLEEKISQMFMIGIPDQSLSNETQQLIQELQPGGVILFSHNIKNADQLRVLTNDLQNYSHNELMIAVDMEGGRVNRFAKHADFSQMRIPSATSMGKGNVLETEAYGRTIAVNLRDYGITMNLAPVVDVNVNPNNPVIGKLGRSFSDDPNTVYAHAEAFTHAHHDVGVATALKHFPGHGGSTRDSHKGLVDITNTYDSDKEIFPYEQLINNGYDNAIMTAHIVNQNIDDVPATLSHEIITEYLRDDLGFSGVVISDDMQMKAISKHYGQEDALIRAINAGVDILTFAYQIEHYESSDLVDFVAVIAAAVRNNEIDEATINASYVRIMKLKEKYDDIRR